MDDHGTYLLLMGQLISNRNVFDNIFMQGFPDSLLKRIIFWRKMRWVAECLHHAGFGNWSTSWFRDVGLIPTTINTTKLRIVDMPRTRAQNSHRPNVGLRVTTNRDDLGMTQVSKQFDKA